MDGPFLFYFLCVAVFQTEETDELRNIPAQEESKEENQEL